MQSSTPNQSRTVGARRRAVFEDRYGRDGLDRLFKALGQPCVTFAEIAEHFGVTRERVRQWHLELMPGAPRGHERQRLCRLYRQERQLLRDPLLRSFYQNVRRHAETKQLTPVRSAKGFRKHTLRLNQQVVLVKQARRAPNLSTTVYTLRVGTRQGEFIYYRLSENDFLFVPRSALPKTVTTFVDNGTSRYLPYRNSFAALVPGAIALAERHERRQVGVDAHTFTANDEPDSMPESTASPAGQNDRSSRPCECE